ncbi:helix-turn-helix transcriptional regulator [Sphingobacterium sp. SGG-5]|uniref:helix-turn-helix transcriptional regulator n=1 Tax=Sphingobacterium sp. SGG-5 TaxID=2710881 RepID=UPI0013EB9F30|nr:AraC family transcriptional regulator [Sphingobacterium sp. SGG-5]NGM60929.1 helix-turn-helix transcriptional regulator [Sphingobacterium sp. SGG-5]
MKPIYAKPSVANLAAFQIRKDEFDLLDTKWHYHNEYEIAFIRYPHGKRIAGGSIHTFEVNDLVFYGPNLPHAWSHEINYNSELDEENKYAIIIHFSDECFGEQFFKIPEMSVILSLMEKSKRGLSIYGATKSRIIDLMKKMLHQNGPLRVISLLQILHELAEKKQYKLLSSAGYWENINDHDSLRMSAIYEYLLHNYTNEITLEDIAGHANISPSAFCRYFKARTKKTLKEFVNDLRINYACQLLEENKMNITQICFAVGYNNISNFNRRFKELRDITPQQYRTHILSRHMNNTNL